MQIQVLKSKIHQSNGADLNYIGSITIDESLLEASNIIEGEKVSIVNINNGERFETYAIKGEKTRNHNTKPAAKVQKRRYHYYYFLCDMEFEEAKTFKPWVIFPNENDNSLT
jgi:aspartate 1-decarboxylase